MDISVSQVIAFRIGERITLTVVVLLISLVVMVGFWRTVQSVRVQDGGKLGIAGSFVLSTPVFVLLSIVGYAWVSLAHPITVGAPVQPDAGSQTASVTPIPGTFIGSTPLDPKPLSDPDYERHLAREQIRSLNCLAAGQTVPDRERDSLGSVKFSLMARVWSDDWGSARDFDNWVRGLSTASPNTAARAVFEEVHEPC